MVLNYRTVCLFISCSANQQKRLWSFAVAFAMALCNEMVPMKWSQKSSPFIRKE